MWGWRRRGEAIKIILAVGRCQKNRHTHTHINTLPESDNKARKKNAWIDNKENTREQTGRRQERRRDTRGHTHISTDKKKGWCVG